MSKCLTCSALLKNRSIFAFLFNHITKPIFFFQPEIEHFIRVISNPHSLKLQKLEIIGYYFSPLKLMNYNIFDSAEWRWYPVFQYSSSIWQAPLWPWRILWVWCHQPELWTSLLLPTEQSLMTCYLSERVINHWTNINS